MKVLLLFYFVIFGYLSFAESEVILSEKEYCVAFASDMSYSTYDDLSDSVHPNLVKSVFQVKKDFLNKNCKKIKSQRSAKKVFNQFKKQCNQEIKDQFDFAQINKAIQWQIDLVSVSEYFAKKAADIESVRPNSKDLIKLQMDAVKKLGLSKDGKVIFAKDYLAYLKNKSSLSASHVTIVDSFIEQIKGSIQAAREYRCSEAITNYYKFKDEYLSELKWILKDTDQRGTASSN